MQKKLYELKENPLSTAIYGEAEDVSDLVEGIKTDGILTPLLVKPDGTIISGHRRYMAARQAGLIMVPVKEVAPRDAVQEERWIILANKQRKKTPEQEIREIKRMKALLAPEGREKVLAVGAQNNAARAEEKRNRAAFLETKKADMITETPSSESEFNVEEIYNETAERIEKSHESQMQHSAVELPHSEGQSTPSTMQSPHSAVQTQSKPEPINMNKEIARDLGISTNRIHQLETIDKAVEAGVPEAKEALDRANKGEITVNRAYEITKKATTPEEPIQIPFSEGAAAVPNTPLYEFYKRAKPVGAWVEELKAQLRDDSPDMTLSVAYALASFVSIQLQRYEELSDAIEDYVERHGGESIEPEEEI